VALIQAINDSDAFKIAIDVPSGLDARGRPCPVAVQADETLTVGAMKESFLQREASDYIGRISVLRNVGLSERETKGELQWSDWSGERWPQRKAYGHKGTFGHLFIVAGSPGYHGAAVLCARGAMRSQPGLITVATAPETYLPVAAQLQAPMVRGWGEVDLVVPERTTSVVAGPGLAAAELPVQIKRSVQDLWSRFEGVMVADASALAWLPESSSVKGVRVITPHPGEAARMLGETIEEIQADRKTAVRKLSHKYGKCWVVLKGHQTMIGKSEGPIFVNASGNATLAQGGTGDILAGYLGGLLAQQGLREDIERTICHGVWKHGNGGDLATEKNPAWMTEELPQWL
jgi:NAD(P)H-hydrate epimerase